ncbi:threonine aldolase family protein [Maricaulis salignorans]|uniref:Threonine aldolase n=1 Tax=Maricaulis salignorans TaxID=144026 RepID=A0A1G9N4E4_9PROT|nr:beta-eliminating lyase-related protein [Maricaulis salignorans]SDL81264.1 Threonine aldolase [Maricaulis salignorans]
MIDAGLRAGCDISLGFPHHGAETAADHLRAVADYMDREGFATEMYLGGPMVAALEAKIAGLLGKPAAMWCPTGTMAQGIAARIHAARTGRNRIQLHPTSHLELHEEQGYHFAHGLDATLIGEWSSPLAADDLQPGAACAFIELPQRHNGGALPVWGALDAIKVRGQALNLPMHLDGARIWSTRPFYDDRSYGEICEGFASVYVSLYKDIGAAGGAVLAGDADFIAEARLWLARFGGRIISPAPMVPDALRLLDRRLELMPALVKRARNLAAALTGIEGVTVTPDPPQVNMFHLRLPCDASTAERARDDAARQTGVWLGNRFWDLEDAPVCALEITAGEYLLGLPDARLVDAVTVLAGHVAAAIRPGQTKPE